MSAPRRIHDPQVLRAISHPVRNRILDELGAQGSLRAADIARELDIPANQASFHLRQLAKYALVEEDPAAARDKRDRVWRLADEGGLAITFKDVEELPGGAAAADVYRRTASAWAQYVVQRAYATEPAEGAFRGVNESSLLLTRDEARELSDELVATIDRWAERTRGDRATERRTYLYFSALQPHPGRPSADGPAPRH